jgi:hypothetical protein
MFERSQKGIQERESDMIQSCQSFASHSSFFKATAVGTARDAYGSPAAAQQLQQSQLDDFKPVPSIFPWVPIWPAQSILTLGFIVE